MTKFRLLCLFLLNSRRNANAPQRVALPTPTYGSPSMGASKPYGSAASFGASKPYGSASFETSKPYGSASFDTSKPYGSASSGSSKPSHGTSFETSAPSYYDNNNVGGTAPPVSSSTYDNQVRPLQSTKCSNRDMCHVLDQVFLEKMQMQIKGHCLKLREYTLFFPCSNLAVIFGIIFTCLS